MPMFMLFGYIGAHFQISHKVRSMVRALTKGSFTIIYFNFSSVMVLFRMSIVCLFHVLSSRKKLEFVALKPRLEEFLEESRL